MLDVNKTLDEAGVDNFSVAMKAKLEKKRVDGRGGWHDQNECSAAFLSQLLREHVEKGDPVDVANLAMMLHQRGERIARVVNLDKSFHVATSSVLDGTPLDIVATFDTQNEAELFIRNWQGRESLIWRQVK